MIKSCRSCSKYLSCEKLCPEVEKTLEKVYKYNKYGPEIAVTPSQLEKFGDSKIETPSVDWTVEDREKLKEYIDTAIPYNKKKQRRRFNDFLRCTTMIKIAEKANTTKQNIQKQFQGPVNKILKEMTDNLTQPKQTITPYQFKLIFEDLMIHSVF